MEFGPGDKLRILHVHQVLGVEAFGGKLRIAEHADLPRTVCHVLQGDPPYFMGGTHRHIVQRPAADSVVLAHEFRIAGTVVAFRLILLQRLFYRLPAGAPEISGFLIPQVDIPARFIKLVECIPQDPSGSSALHKAVSAGIHRNDRTVIRGSQVIRPGTRGVRIGDDIFSGFLVKVSVLHFRSSSVWSCGFSLAFLFDSYYHSKRFHARRKSPDFYWFFLPEYDIIYDHT